MPLASSWRASLLGTRFVAPDAPMHHRYGHQWFSTEGNPLGLQAHRPMACVGGQPSDAL
ncbi:hypothetical protein [Rhizobium leguminosarum]